MTPYRIPDGFNIFDIAINTLGSAEKAVELMLQNDIPNLDFDFEGKALTIQYNELEIVQKDSPLVSEKVYAPITKWMVSQGQSIFDVALQVGYTIDNIVDLLKTNSLSINNNLSSQQVINFDSEKVVFVPFAKELRKIGYVINTSEPKIIPGGSFDDSFDDSSDN